MRNFLSNQPKCPGCGRTLDGFTDVKNANNRPKSGDISFCLYCREVLEFDENMNFKLAPQEFLDNNREMIDDMRRIMIQIHHEKYGDNKNG